MFFAFLNMLLFWDTRSCRGADDMCKFSFIAIFLPTQQCPIFKVPSSVCYPLFIFSFPFVLPTLGSKLVPSLLCFPLICEILVLVLPPLLHFSCPTNTYRIKDDIFCFAHLWWCHNGWASNILSGGCWRSRYPPQLKYWMPIHYDTIEEEQNKKIIFYSHS